MKRIIFLISLTLIFSITPKSFSSEIDGALDTSLGTGGYIDWTSSVDENSLQIIKLSDGRYLHFGSSAVTANSPRRCETETTLASAYKTEANGEVIPDFGNGVPGAYKTGIEGRNYFISAVEDQNGDIFFLGVSHGVTPVVNVGGIGCEYSNRKIYITKISRDGKLDLTFGESGFREIVESSGDGYPSYLSILNNKTILVSFHEDSFFDLLSLNLDGTLNSRFGNSGKVKLINSEMRVFKSVQVDSTVILFGDKYNPEGDGSNRWAISSVDLAGNELDNFKGNRNYEYSTGEKEGIYVLPRYYNSQIYIVAGVKTSTTYDVQALRINESGERDRNYGGYLRDQLVSIGVTPCGYCSGEFSLDPYGRILVSIGTETITDSGQRQSVIIRLDQAGRIDRTFGDGGKIWINYDYQAGVEAIDSNRYLIYGSQYSTSYCAENICGLYKKFISQISQLPINHAAAKRAAEAAAKREADKKLARSEISNSFKNSIMVTIEAFKQAEIAGITLENIDAVQAEILELPVESRSDIVQIIKVARKYEVIGKIASDQVYSMLPNEYVEIGLISTNNKNKFALVFAVRKLSVKDRDSYVEIQSAIATEMAKIQARKDRAASIKERMSTRRTG